jgi:purine-binding chemotaxis protein CheW
VQIVTLGLAGEIYGIRIDKIQEILMDEEPTRVPNLPSFLKGIINVRKKVIPIVEGTERLGYPPEEAPDPGEGRIFTVEYRDKLIGIRVEQAHEVLNVDEEAIQSSPEMIERFGGRFVKGVVEYNEHQDRRSHSQNRQYQRDNTQADMTDDVTSQDNQQSVQDSESTNILLLDLDELFTGEELEEIEAVQEREDLSEVDD